MAIFSEEELLVLTDMVGQVELFGVPQLTAHRMNQIMAIPKGIERLEEKGLLAAGKLTKKGFLVASLIERYVQSEMYICLDKTYYVATGEQAIVLKREEAGYQLTIEEPETFLGQVLVEYSILRREGTEEEKEFRSRRARLTLEELQKQGIEAALVLGSVHKRERELMKSEYALLLSQGVLYRLDSEGLKRISQFWVNKWLVDQLQISYEVPEDKRKERVSWFDR
ncbi:MULTISPECIES: DUF5081 family protein [unclassified Enterococcus]|uniref:DUF5081 family protein n=1 Tax=unclassified Enterococcus TaxID=2608891 RepID=UPI001CE19579|nr:MULTISPECIES: DUF5081 family protein [unclassified Enterococcus]MCA5014413.1 DUF5081 family protein [Enterococcus sp. S23]MCA5017474.1 DUF5081 family protein [Enterococcus sp. S22(2020)]